MQLQLNIKKIEKQRKRLGMNYTQLADKMGFSKQRLSYILKKKLIIHADKFGRVFDVSGKDLII